MASARKAKKEKVEFSSYRKIASEKSFSFIYRPVDVSSIEKFVKKNNKSGRKNNTTARKRK